FSPDGKRIVFWSTREGGAQLYLMRPDGTDVRPVIRKDEAVPTTEWEKNPCWLPVARPVLQN
ncbi:MAG: TolB family protein, partial [Vulcanimicrobiota bacterium]